MKKSSLPNRAISVVLSTMLAFTMVPASAFAANAESNTDSTAAKAEEAQDAPASDAASEKAPSVVNEEHTVDAVAKEGQATPTADAPERVRAQVQVTNGDATLLSYNNMSFQIGQNAEGEPEAALVGLATTLEGALDIPAAVTAGGTTYPVTNIRSTGGGVRAQCALRVRANCRV